MAEKCVAACRAARLPPAVDALRSTSEPAKRQAGWPRAGRHAVSSRGDRDDLKSLFARGLRRAAAHNDSGGQGKSVRTPASPRARRARIAPRRGEARAPRRRRCVLASPQEAPKRPRRRRKRPRARAPRRTTATPSPRCAPRTARTAATTTAASSTTGGSRRRQRDDGGLQVEGAARGAAAGDVERRRGDGAAARRRQPAAARRRRRPPPRRGDGGVAHGGDVDLARRQRAHGRRLVARERLRRSHTLVASSSAATASATAARRRSSTRCAPTVAALSVGYTPVGDAGAAALAEALGSNNALHSLDLSWNLIGDAGVGALRGVRTNVGLNALDLGGQSGAGLGAATAHAAAGSLAANRTLRTLRLYGNRAATTASAPPAGSRATRGSRRSTCRRTASAPAAPPRSRACWRPTCAPPRDAALGRLGAARDGARAAGGGAGRARATPARRWRWRRAARRCTARRRSAAVVRRGRRRGAAGPFIAAQLRELNRGGLLPADAQWCTVGMHERQPLEHIPQLIASIGLLVPSLLDATAPATPGSPFSAWRRVRRAARRRCFS